MTPESFTKKRGAPTRNALVRMLRIHEQIKRGRYPSTRQLALDLEMSTRTVERDIETMRDFLHAPIAYDRTRRGFYYEDGSFELRPIQITEGEAIALILGQKLLMKYRGTPFEPNIRKAMEKLQLLLPDKISVDASFLDELVSFDVEPVRGDEDAVSCRFEVLSQSMEKNETVFMRYFSASRGEWTERELDPYHLRYNDGAWYAIGFCHLRQEVKIFALDRIQDIRLTGRRFERPEDFSVEEYLGDSWNIERGEKFRARIRFDPFQARFIRERIWHPSQRIEELEDGSIILNITVSGLGEVTRWVMQYGSHAEVLEPPSLRASVKHHAQEMVSKYA